MPINEYGYNDSWLKICPFCGGEEAFLDPVKTTGTDREPAYGVRVECPDCGIETATVLKMDTAKYLWNRRANEKA